MLKKSSFIILAVLLISNIFTWIVVYNLNQPQSLKVVFFDVGQGDSFLIKTHLGHYILIDGGQDKAVLEKLSKEIPFHHKEIDLMILTHGHADHLNGLMEVLDHYQVNAILWNGVGLENNLVNQWQRKIENKNVKIAQSGQRIKAEDFHLDVLYPFEPLKENKDLNLTSIVLRLVYKDKKFLFTGDIYQSVEKELVDKKNFCLDKEEEIKCRGMELESNVLKVAHHGSKTSTEKFFIEEVNPQIAVISAGLNNRFNHPHPETLETLLNYGIRVERTDLEGDIKIVVK